MSAFTNITVSEQFIELCQAQLVLLAQNLSAQKSAIYLTENFVNSPPKLVPILIYPASNSENNSALRLSESINNEDFNLDWYEQTSNNLSQLIRYNKDQISPHQLILPLIYQDNMMGFLATNRSIEPWQKRDILQVEEVAKTISLARFLDQRSQIAEQKIQQNYQLQIIQNEHLDDFLHQLRNPLTAIRTFAKLLLKRLIPEDKNYSIAQNILREGDRLKDLIQDFSEDWEVVNSNYCLDLPDIESTSFFLTESIQKKESIDIYQLIKPLIDGITTLAKEKNITVINHIESDLPIIFSNAKALREIFNNLLDNAIKYTPEGGVLALEVMVQKQDQNIEQLVIEISDTGYGIPHQDQGHIFERRYRGVQAQSDIEGTGLGLAIVKELCDKLNIKIEIFSPSLWLKNQANNGTTFSLFIPLK
ncbi:MAG: HAMP domain-containing histidine kinase [Cyanobacterium sp. T60_A2020_053]|nr:HAMP domain-containing histidine kinase [Cyanobacterium sp. T60_A2020_053]